MGQLSMTPSLIVYLLPPAIYALLFHFFWGRGYGQMLLYLAASIVGFAIGVLVARFLHSSWLSLGDVPVLEGSLGALAALLLARRLLM